MTPQLQPVEALIYAMVTAAAVDRRITEVELSRIGTLVSELPVFRAMQGNWLTKEAQDCGRVLSKPDGVRRVLDLIKAALPKHLRETAYVLAAEVTISDLSVKDEETEFLSLLAQALELDQLVCAALNRAARARHSTI